VTYNPWSTLRALPHIELVITRLPKGQGWWLPADEAIVLDDRLGQAERRSVLEHELQHAAAGDQRCCGPDGGRQERRQERRADDLAARQLVSLDALAEALTWALCADEVAEALHVTVHVVRVRLHGLTQEEKDYIDGRVAAREGAA
jgi:Zn-dependent peptidase ImmA (M78 family)